MALALPKIDDDKFFIQTSPGFSHWLKGIAGSIAFSTYQVGKVLLLGLNAQNKLSVFERTFPRAMGIGLSEDQKSLLLASKTHIYEFDNLLSPGQKSDFFDALYAPHTSWITGDVDIHDIAFDGAGKPVFISTLFNCIGTVERGYSFKPLWRPSFISKYTAEDRCHLNGMAMKDGKPKYVTCVSDTNSADGWRAGREDRGMVIDVETDEKIVTGLSMPHSPRLHKGRLWLLNSGKGELGWVDIDKGEFNPVGFCRGFARGLTLVGKYAVIGLSEPREGKTFDGLPLQNILADKNISARCGLEVIDIETGRSVEWLIIDGVIRELYDVAFLKNIITPSMIGLIGPEVQHTISLADHP